jgi:hypothetical protein
MKRNKIKITNKKEFGLKNVRLYILSGICGVLAVVSIFMTIDSAASGTEMANLENKETSLMTEQQQLQQDLVQNLSVSSLQEKSAELGFTKISNLVYVSEGVPVARLSDTNAGQ